MVEKEADESFWTQRMVEAAQSFEKIFSSRTYCQEERAHVSLFDKACFHYKPAQLSVSAAKNVEG